MKTRVSVISLTALLALTACGTGGTPAPTTCTAPAVLQGGVCVTPVTTGVVQVNNPNGLNVAFTPSIANTAAVAPGNYTVTWSRNGYTSQTENFTVTAGQTKTLNAPTLAQIPPTNTQRGAYYIAANGQLTAIPAADLRNADKFVFNAWLEDLNPDGTANDGVVVADGNVISGTPTGDERTEVAPDRTQNLAVAYVGYQPVADGPIYPVAGATVRWNITGLPDVGIFTEGLRTRAQETLTEAEYTAFQAAILSNSLGYYNSYFGLPVNYNSPVIFGAADEGSNDPGVVGGIQPLWISAAGKQADTITNYALAVNTPFPSSNANYPLYNGTSITTPNVDGLTWTTLFANRDYAAAEVVAVASIGDVEIDKVVLDKFFAPRPDLTLTKDVTGERQVDTTGAVVPDSTVTSGVDGVVSVINGQVQMTVTLTNDGSQVTNVNLTDVLNTGNGATYGIVDNVVTVNGTDYTLPATPGTVAAGGGTASGNGNPAEGFDGLDLTNFSLGQGQTVTISYWVDASQPGPYCDAASVSSYYSIFFGAATAGDLVNLYDEACAVFIAPEFRVTKSFGTNADGSLITTALATPNQPKTVTITVTNNGLEAGTYTSVQEFLSQVNGVTVTGPISTPAAAPTTNAAYSVSNPSAGGTIGAGGDDITWVPVAPDTAFTLQPGESDTFTFNVQASADGQYCDVAAAFGTSFGADPAVSNEACLVVVTPTITKVNDPVVLNPGDPYTSTITVTNPSAYAPITVNLSDTLGANSFGSYVNLSGATYSINGGPAVNATVGTNVVNANAVTIPAGGTLTLKLNNTIPVGALGGAYCNVASFVPVFNTEFRREARSCVYVQTFVAIQTQLTDTVDPIVRNGGTNADGRTTYVSVLSNEVASNEAITTSYVDFAFGAQTGALDTTLPAVDAGDGLFNNPTATRVYFDPNPQRDPTTGAVISDYTNATAVLLTSGADYTIGTNAGGDQNMTITKDLPAGAAFFIVHEGVSAPVGLPAINPVSNNAAYSTNYVWVATAAGGTQFVGSSAEPTSVK